MIWVPAILAMVFCAAAVATMFGLLNGPIKSIIEQRLSRSLDASVTIAALEGNLVPFDNLLAVLSTPYEDQPAVARYADPPRLDQVVHQTFCGT